MSRSGRPGGGPTGWISPGPDRGRNAAAAPVSRRDAVSPWRVSRREPELVYADTGVPRGPVGDLRQPDDVVRTILTDAPALPEESTTAAAVTFRTLVPDLATLSDAERALLSEWLDRVSGS